MTLSATSLTLCLLCSLTVLNATAQDWQFLVQDQDGNPLDDAVIELLALEAEQKPQAHAAQAVTIKQQGLNFVPFVSAVPVGTLIDFPNFDRTRHHVYSFSAAKMFEIQLYHDQPEAPIEFDTPGIVALGCNIHDYMEAYIYISESPLLAVTDTSGQATFSNLPMGEYQLTIWHPFQQQEYPVERRTLSENQQLSQHELEVIHRTKQPTPQRGFGS